MTINSHYPTRFAKYLRLSWILWMEGNTEKRGRASFEKDSKETVDDLSKDRITPEGTCYPFYKTFEFHPEWFCTVINDGIYGREKDGRGKKGMSYVGLSRPLSTIVTRNQWAFVWSEYFSLPVLRFRFFYPTNKIANEYELRKSART